MNPGDESCIISLSRKETLIRRVLILAVILLLAACASQPPCPADTGLVGVIGMPCPISGTETASASTGFVIPSLAQARVGQGGPIPADVQGKIDELIIKADGQIPGAAELDGAWNGGYGDSSRHVVYAKNSSGDIIWTSGEYTILWERDKRGNIIGVSPSQEFAVIPNSQDAVAIFAGDGATAGFGEKPAIVRNPVTLPDGQTQEFLKYFDFATWEWTINPNVLKALQVFQPEMIQAAEELGYSQDYINTNFIELTTNQVQIGDLSYPALIGKGVDGKTETLGLKLDIGYGLGTIYAPLNEADINNIAQQLDCSSYGGCIFWAHAAGESNSPRVLFTSTGIIKTLDLGPIGQPDISVEVVLGIIKTPSGNPRFLLGIVQKRNVDTPDVNLLPFSTNYLMNRFQDMGNTKVYTIEEFAQEMPKGKMLEFGLPVDYDQSSSDQGYLAVLRKFIETEAEAQLEGLPIIDPEFIQDYLPYQDYLP